MRILFIYPNAGSQLGFNYGVAHIAAVLKQRGHEVHCWQFCEELAPLPTREEYAASLRDLAPDLVGFSVVTNQWSATQDLAAWTKEALDCTVTIGGIHATIAPEEMLNTGLFDSVFVGECDEAFPDYVDRLARGEDIRDQSNMAILDNGVFRSNPVRELPDLAKLPPKDYEVFDFQKIIDAKNGWVGLMASRGCPFSCTYCFNHLLVGKYRADLQCGFRDLNYIRHFDIGAMMDEIVYLLKNYTGIRMFIFDDDLFTYDRDYVEAFCAAYKKTCDVPFVVNGHVGLFDEARARALADAGCRIVKFGLESGSPKIRDDVMNRHMSNDAIIEAISTVEGLGMHSSVFVMIGLPHETEDDLRQTLDLLGTARPGRFRWTFFFPFPGTRANEMAREGGFVDDERMQTMTNFTDASCLTFGPDMDLLLRKVGRIMPWFVNAGSSLNAAPFYKERVDALLALDADAWEAVAPTLVDEDKRLSADMVQRGHSHYAIKYNAFMGVISDYFLNEE